MAALRCGVENEFQILAETEIEHLVRFVEHDGRELAQIEAVAFQMIAQAPGCANDDMGAEVELPCLRTHIHAADTGYDARAGLLVKPVELALHLQRELARRGNDQDLRLGGREQMLCPPKQRRGDGQPEGNRLPRAGLGRDE